MDSLALVNRIHHCLVIKWILPSSTTTHLFTWFKSYYQIVTKTLGSLVASPCHAIIPGCIEDSWVLSDVLHIDPHLYVSMAMFLIWHRSTVYYLVATISHSHGVMDPQCISQWPWYQTLSYTWIRSVYEAYLLNTKHRYAFLVDTPLIWSDHCCFFISFTHSIHHHCKVFRPSIILSNLTL